MGSHTPSSPATYLSKLCAAWSKLSSLGLVKGLLRIAPGLPAAALAGLVVMFLAWSCEHRARQREAGEAQRVKQQAAAEISRLQKQAASAVRDAQQTTQTARELEAQRQQLARESEGLLQSLESLHKQELARTNEVATLTTQDVVNRVASRLQEQGLGIREQGLGNRQQGSGNREQGSGNREQGLGNGEKGLGNREQGLGNGEKGLGNGEKGTGQQLVNSLTSPAPADESAIAGHPLTQGEDGKSLPGGAGQGSQAALVLTDQGVRKVETAFVALDSCRQQSQLMSQQVSNCQQQAKLDSSLEAQQAATIAKLNAALADKDQILARSEAAHRAELKAARGSWRSRICHAVEIFAGGFIAGVLVR